MITVFELMLAYQLKHFAADYPLQANRYMLGKFLPGWAFVLPLLAHVGVHAVMTFAIALVFGKSVPFALAAAVFDASVHFVMDRIKASPRWMGRWKPLTGPQWMEATAIVDRSGSVQVPFENMALARDDHAQAQAKLTGNKLFWIAIGFDQAVHHLTHYAIIWAILGFPR